MTLKNRPKSPLNPAPVFHRLVQQEERHAPTTHALAGRQGGAQGGHRGGHLQP